MPDFTCQNQLSGVALQAPKKLTQIVPFNLTTVDRGTEKDRILQEMKDKEEQERIKAA